MHKIWTAGYLPVHSGEARQKKQHKWPQKAALKVKGRIILKLKCSYGTLLFGEEGQGKQFFFLLLNSMGEISGLSSVWCIPDTQGHPRCPHETNRCDTAPAGLLAFETAAGD